MKKTAKGVNAMTACLGETVATFIHAGILAVFLASASTATPWTVFVQRLQRVSYRK